MYWSLCKEQEESESGKFTKSSFFCSVFLNFIYKRIDKSVFVGLCRSVGYGRRRNVQTTIEDSNASWILFNTNAVAFFDMNVSLDQALSALADSVSTKLVGN